MQRFFAIAVLGLLFASTATAEAYSELDPFFNPFVLLLEESSCNATYNAGMVTLNQSIAVANVSFSQIGTTATRLYSVWSENSCQSGAAPECGQVAIITFADNTSTSCSSPNFLAWTKMITQPSVAEDGNSTVVMYNASHVNDADANTYQLTMTYVCNQSVATVSVGAGTWNETDLGAGSMLIEYFLSASSQSYCVVYPPVPVTPAPTPAPKKGLTVGAIVAICVASVVFVGVALCIIKQKAASGAESTYTRV